MKKKLIKKTMIEKFEKQRKKEFEKNIFKNLKKTNEMLLT